MTERRLYLSRDYCSAFGGDPSRITIWGQSAGGGSVRALLASPVARSLYAAAIPASNLAGYNYATTYSDYYTPAESFAAAGQSILAANNCSDVSTALTCLSKIPPATLLTGDIARYVVQDGTYITSPRLDVRKPGSSASVPVLIGAMADDGGPFISYTAPGMNRTTAIASVLPGRDALAAAVDASSLFPTPSSGNYSLDLFNLTARITTDVEFRCLDQATVHSAVRNGVWPTAWYYQFDRAYQMPGWNPNPPTCQPPPTAKYPLGDPSLPYFKWCVFIIVSSCLELTDHSISTSNSHSGDLYFGFGTFGQFDLAFRDEYDQPFTQLVVDSFTAFVRDHNPNPSLAFLAARGYTNTIAIAAKTGTWSPVTPKKDSLRLLAWPPRQSEFLELDQCKLLGLPVTYYDDNA
jgi:hypothetical protein